ncbi:unnamed protein product [Hyaloperonospora brassicae]|uniref:RxLR effector candidate protein n=1 Tax=Hyaloperonospora brassicae TaxID=162125 RepID=A0AAV0UF80_HYABA|nr:unnamed protein product [Hyaloperonospora brassicae]
MEALKGMISKTFNKSKGNDEYSRSGPDSSAVYRSSDARGEPDVGTKSCSREATRGGRNVDRQNDPDLSSPRSGGGKEYLGESSGTEFAGHESERSMKNNPEQSYLTTSGKGTSSTTSCRHHGTSGEYHDRSDDRNDDEYSSYSKGAAKDSFGDDERGGVHGTRGMHGNTSRSSRSGGDNVTGDNDNYGIYTSGDSNFADKGNGSDQGTLGMHDSGSHSSRSGGDGTTGDSRNYGRYTSGETNFD